MVCRYQGGGWIYPLTFIIAGLAEGIKNLEKMIVRAKGYRMVIDWKMAYDELKKITYNMKVGMRKKKPKPAPKGNFVVKYIFFDGIQILFNLYILVNFSCFDFGSSLLDFYTTIVATLNRY